MPVPFTRRQKKIIAAAADSGVILLAVFFSFLLRFEWAIPPEYTIHIKLFFTASLFFSLLSLWYFGIYRFTLAYISLSELFSIIKAVSASTILLSASLFILRDWPPLLGFPRSIIIANYFLTLLAISGLRIGKRLLKETGRKSSGSEKRALIIGAGGAGEELARSLRHNHSYAIIGFIDDSRSKQHTSIHGIPVIGTREDISEVTKKFNIGESIIALPAAGPSVIQEMVRACRNAGLEKIKVLPSLREIIDGKVTLANLREVAIEDLLGRKPIKLDTSLIGTFLTGKRVLVTGAAGSIGSTLCKEILRFNPSLLLALDQNETGMFHLERDLEKHFPGIEKYFDITDVCHAKKIEALFERWKPHVVFHAAAYKHVPLMERHPLEAVRNNVWGTLTVGTAALNNSVDTFVLISSDKAVNPTSIMGTTKRVCELLSQSFNQRGQTKFCAVRFGNVLDSQGNVTEIFKKQIAAGGPVEVTHPDMRRYFMVTSEACLLVMEAGASTTEGGEIFMLDMGEPVKIIDLAREMISLSGFTPEVDIPIVFTKIRPGEKLFEELATDDEVPTQYDKIFITRTRDAFAIDLLHTHLPALKEALSDLNEEKPIAVLKTIVTTYQPDRPRE